MFRVTRQIRFCYGHRLLNYDGKCRHLHGHNGLAIIALEAPRLDSLGMVVDFSQIKRVVSGWINDRLDLRKALSETFDEIEFHTLPPDVTTPKLAAGSMIQVLRKRP